jgi:hypothetical protein
MLKFHAVCNSNKNTVIRQVKGKNPLDKRINPHIALPLEESLR